MSAPAITIKLTDKAVALLNRMQSWPVILPQAIARGMDEANQLIIATIQRDYLSFPKSQPPTLEGLRVQSGDYRRSLRASKAVVTGGAIISSIGTSVTKGGFSYPRLHEFGGTVKRKPRAGVVRLKTDRKGVLVRQKDGKLAVFARRTNKQFKEVAYQGKAYEATYPARAPIQRGITASMERTGKIISRHIIAAFNGQGGVA